MGLAHVGLKRHQIASEYYRKAIKLELVNFDTYYFLALSCFLSNRYQEALYAINESIQLQPNNAEAYYTLGHIYIKLGHFNKAIQPLHTAMTIQPGLPNKKQEPHCVKRYRKTIIFQTPNSQPDTFCKLIIKTATYLQLF
jgi:tetratricopeptide (TPR) repeat protein